MEINQENKNGIHIFRLSGQLALLGVREAKSTLMPLVGDDAVTSVLIDMSDVSMLDSSGIGFIIAMSKAMTKKQGHFGLFSCSDLVDKIISATNISNVINVYPNENDAIAGN